MQQGQAGSQKQQKNGQLELDTMMFVNHLNLLVGHQQQHIYGKASQQKIERTIQQFSVVDQQGEEFSIFDNVQKFKKFSPGVYLTFRFLKHVIIMFCIIGLISLAQLILLLQSPYYQGFQNVVRVNLLRITIASLQPKHYDIYVGLDMANTLIIFGFLIWWSQNLRRLAKKCNECNRLPSYLTVQLKNIPDNYSQLSLLKYLQLVNGVFPQQIYTGRDYGKFLRYYTDLTETAINFRVLKELYEHEDNQQGKKQQAYPLIKQFLKLKNKYFKIKSEEYNETKYEPKQVFIVMQNYYDRQKVLKEQPNFFTSLSKKLLHEQSGFEFKACQTQPEAIVWQNIGISFLNYSLRFLLVFIVLCACSILGVIVIFMLEILETASIGDAYYFHEKNMGTQYSTQQYEELHGSKQGSSQIKQDYAKLTLLIMLTPFVIFVFKKLVMAFLAHTVNFRKHPSQMSKIKSQTITLTFFYFTVVAALHLVLYLKAETQNSQYSIYQILYPIIEKIFTAANYSPASIHMYTDFSLDWYKQATFFIIIICATSFNVASAFKFLVGFISFKLQKKAARKQKTIYGVKKKLHGVDLHIEHIYATMHTISLFGFLYGCPIPVTIFFCLFNLIFLFYTSKWTFIRYATRPLRMGHSLSRTSVNILFIGLIIHCVMAPIFLGAKGIGQDSHHYSYANIHHDKIADDFYTIQQRYQKFGPFYLTIASIIFVYITCRKILIQKIITKIRKSIKKNFQGTDQMSMSQMSKDQQHFGLYPSYSMHNNKKYSQVLRNVYILNKLQANRSTFLPSQLSENFKIYDTSKVKKQNIFQTIIQISRKYLDKQKYKNEYEEIQKISKAAGYNYSNKQYLDVESNQLSAQRASNQQMPGSGAMQDNNIDYIIETQN